MIYSDHTLLFLTVLPQGKAHFNIQAGIDLNTDSDAIISSINSSLPGGNRSGNQITRFGSPVARAQNEQTQAFRQPTQQASQLSFRS